MDDRQLIRALAVTRIVFGALGALAPGPAGRAWVGEDAAGPRVKTITRGLAFRDAALGLGTLLSLQHGESVRGWVEGAALADAGDALATLIGWRHLPELRRWLVLGTALSAALLEVRLARTERQP